MGVGTTSNFWQTRPDEGQPATQKTLIYLGFTERALYIGAKLYDSNPNEIIISDSRRDADLDETDSFQVIIDSFLDRQNGFVFGTNPAGIQYDGQVTKEGTSVFGSGGGGFNRDWDTTWEVKTATNDKGWVVEMEIPFKSLRYASATAPVWGINFQRNIRRNNEVAFWSPLPRQHSLYRISQAGTVEGINVPPQKNLKVTPYGLAQAQRSNEFRGTESDSEFGFDLKYSITPSLTLDLTYNTDFAQVEVDEVVVNLDRFSVFLPEKRPFFLENAGQFSVGSPEEVELFFSRRIGISDEGARLPIEGGLRLSGKIGNSTNVGLLHMRSEARPGEAPENDFSVIRLNRELKNRSSLGAIYVQREGDGSFGGIDKRDDYNRTYGIDGRWGIGDEIMVSGYLAKTDTKHLNGKDHAFKLKAEYNSQKWFNSIGYSEVGEDFNPEVGFLSRSGYRKAEFLIFHRYRPKNWWGLQELRPHVSYKGYWDFDGTHESGFLHIDNHWEFKTGLEFHTGVNFTHERVDEPFDIIDGHAVQPGEYDNEELALVFLTNQGAPLSFNLHATVGGFFGGDKLSLAPVLKYRIGETFNSELSWQYNSIDLDGANGDFDINVGVLKLAYSFTPKVSLEALIQYDDRTDSVATNLRFAWLQTANAGLYLVYNEVDLEKLGANRNRKELIVKFSYIFDLL
ncbi:MAG: carbohydrate binding family 9 domain-containing protein [Halieaceae bacterium]|nr:carbohydrate binding family 9 domain-containing protein [Halieaceae bacterium]